MILAAYAAFLALAASSVLDEPIRRLEAARSEDSLQPGAFLEELLVLLSTDPCDVNDEFEEKDCRAAWPHFTKLARSILKKSVFEVPLRVQEARFDFATGKVKIALEHGGLGEEAANALGMPGEQYLFTRQPKHDPFCGLKKNFDAPTPFTTVEVRMSAAAAREAAIRRAPNDASALAAVKVTRVARTKGAPGCDVTYMVVSVEGVQVKDADGVAVVETGRYWRKNDSRAMEE